MFYSGFLRAVGQTDKSRFAILMLALGCIDRLMPLLINSIGLVGATFWVVNVYIAPLPTAEKERWLFVVAKAASKEMLGGNYGIHTKELLTCGIRPPAVWLAELKVPLRLPLCFRLTLP